MCIRDRTDPQLIETIYTHPEKISLPDFIRLASFYRPGTEQYREVYEVAAYTYPSCAVALLNDAAASLAFGDQEAARDVYKRQCLSMSILFQDDLRNRCRHCCWHRDR